MWMLTSLWYLLFVGLAVVSGRGAIRQFRWRLCAWHADLAAGDFSLCADYSVITLSTGWSLQINKLQVYPNKRQRIVWFGSAVAGDQRARIIYCDAWGVNGRFSATARCAVRSQPVPTAFYSLQSFSTTRGREFM